VLRRCIRLAVITVAICTALVGCAKPIDFGPAGSASPGAVTGVHHILLTVSDLGRSIRFYRDGLGSSSRTRIRSCLASEAGTTNSSAPGFPARPGSISRRQRDNRLEEISWRCAPPG
jgi:hypothetical protein